MEIRRAQAADLEAAATLWFERIALLRESDRNIELAPDPTKRWQCRAQRWLDDAQVACFVAESDGQIVGLAVVTVSEGRAGLYPERIGVLMELAVDLHQPHSSLSGRLIKKATAWLLSKNIAVLEVQAPASYPVEDAFWRAQGAKLSARHYRLSL